MKLRKYLQLSRGATGAARDRLQNCVQCPGLRRVSHGVAVACEDERSTNSRSQSPADAEPWLPYLFMKG